MGKTNRDELNALVEFAASQAVALAEEDHDLAIESYKRLPEHLQVMVNKAQQRITKARK